MSKSGIQVPKEVTSLFGQIRQEEKIRWIQLLIEDENIIVGQQGEMTDSFENDYNSLHEVVDGPSYFVFRLDEKNQFGSQWLLIWYVPDGSKVKQRMLYSSTVEAVKKDLGGSFFAGDFHTSMKKELLFENFSWESKR
jgi:twinfilin